MMFNWVLGGTHEHFMYLMRYFILFSKQLIKITKSGIRFFISLHFHKFYELFHNFDEKIHKSQINEQVSLLEIHEQVLECGHLGGSTMYLVARG